MKMKKNWFLHVFFAFFIAHTSSFENEDLILTRESPGQPVTGFSIHTVKLKTTRAVPTGLNNTKTNVTVIEEKLKTLSKMPITEENKDKTLHNCKVWVDDIVHSKEHSITPTAYVHLSKILKNVASAGNLKWNSGENFCSVFSSLMATDEKVTEEVNKDKEITNILVDAMDMFAQSYDLEGTPSANFNFYNLNVGITDIPKELAVPGNDVNGENNRIPIGVVSTMVNEQSLQSDGLSSLNNIGSEISVSSGFVTDLPKNNSGIFSLAVLSGNIMSEFLNKSSTKVRLSYIIQKETNVFPKKSHISDLDLSGGNQHTLSSGVVSLSVSNSGGESINNLLGNGNGGVTIKLKPNKKDKGDITLPDPTRTCTFWDTQQESFSSEGCSHVSTTDGDLVQCECNHLTNFAVHETQQRKSDSFTSHPKSQYIVGLLLATKFLLQT